MSMLELGSVENKKRIGGGEVVFYALTLNQELHCVMFNIMYQAIVQTMASIYKSIHPQTQNHMSAW